MSTRQAGSRAPHVTPWPGAGTGSRPGGRWGRAGGTGGSGAFKVTGFEMVDEPVCGVCRSEASVGV